MRRGFIVSVFLLVLTAAPVSAVRLEGRTVILPVIGRFAGDGGTQWRTDLFLHNAFGEPNTVTLKFYDGAGLKTFTTTISPYQSVSLPDVVLGTFGLQGGGGPLEIAATTRIEARARIYNSGNPAGQFGQGVSGIDKELLSRQSSLYGLSGSGARVNVGVMNPNDHAVTVSMYIDDRFNQGIAGEQFELAPHSYRQFSNIFALYNIPEQQGVRVQFNELDDAIYGYASEVRNDTGDAIFTFGTAPNAGP